MYCVLTIKEVNVYYIFIHVYLYAEVKYIHIYEINKSIGYTPRIVCNEKHTKSKGQLTA